MLLLLLLIGSPTLLTIYIVFKIFGGIVKWLLMVIILIFAICLIPILWNYQLPDPGMKTKSIQSIVSLLWPIICNK